MVVTRVLSILRSLQIANCRLQICNARQFAICNLQFAIVVLFLTCCLTGCASFGSFTPPWKTADAKKDKDKGPKDSLVLTGGRGLEREPIDPGLQQELDTAKRLMQEKKYAEAEQLYHKLMLPGEDKTWISSLNPFDPGPDEGTRKKYPRTVYEESLFGEAECQRLQKNYRAAMDTYNKLLVAFSNSQYQTRCCQGLFEIADHWLEATRRQMNEYHEQLEGKRWMVTPALYVHVDKDMPFLDAEGHATAILNTIRLHDIKGPMAEESLFMLGTIAFFRKEYKEADFYFNELFKEFPNSDKAARAIKQSVICKQLMTGGTDYDLRPVEESKKLLMTKMNAYPELAKDEKWIGDQLKMMNIQQADRDFKIAEFYRRTGHPGSAYFYYELVCRRFPGTEYATKAEKQKEQLRGRAEREASTQGASPTLTPMPPPVPIGPPNVPPPASLPGNLDSRPIR
jgi:outer membrane protein assembly factor BamD (BamD/ComL family)